MVNSTEDSQTLTPPFNRPCDANTERSHRRQRFVTLNTAPCPSNYVVASTSDPLPLFNSHRHDVCVCVLLLYVYRIVYRIP